MALESVVYHQQLFCNNNKEPYTSYEGAAAYWPEGSDFDDSASTFDTFLQENSNSSPSTHQWSTSPHASSSADLQQIQVITADAGDGSSPSKRRCSRPEKNPKEIERQRMAHISVERNRRKQMNEYLAVLRGLMPSGYALKGDQASIVGGAINYVKELEQQLQSLEGQKHMIECAGSSSSSSPFSEFLNYPQYATILGRSCLSESRRSKGTAAAAQAEADVEVTMVENNYANLKARSKKRPKQLIKLVSGLQVMRLTILHLNVTTADQIVLYSLSLKVEDDCTFSSADEIAAGVNQIFIRVKDEVAGSIMG